MQPETVPTLDTDVLQQGPVPNDMEPPKPNELGTVTMNGVACHQMALNELENNRSTFLYHEMLDLVADSERLRYDLLKVNQRMDAIKADRVVLIPMRERDGYRFKDGSVGRGYTIIWPPEVTK